MHMDQRSKDLSPGSQCKRDCAESRQCSSHWCNLLFAVQEEPWWGFCHDILMMINLIKTLIIEIINKKIFTPTKTWAWPMCDHKAGRCCSDFFLGCLDDQPSSLATLRPSPGRPWHVQDGHDDYCDRILQNDDDQHHEDKQQKSREPVQTIWRKKRSKKPVQTIFKEPVQTEPESHLLQVHEERPRDQETSLWLE